MSKNQVILFIAISFIGLFCIQNQAIAAPKELADQTKNIVSLFQEQTESWEPIIKKYTLGLFLTLATLDIVFLGIKASLDRAELHDVMRQFAMMLLFCGFIIAVITHYKEWSWQIINGFQKIASELTPVNIKAGTPFQTGIDLCLKILNNVSAWSPIDSLGYIITGLIIIICFALLSAQVIFIKCEAILSLAAAMVLLGLGGSSFTKEYAINAMRYVLAVAFKLFVIQLLLGVGLSFIDAFDLSKSPSYEELFVIIGASVVLLALVSSLPDVCAGIINGSHVSSGMALVKTATAVGGMAFGVGAAAITGAKTLKVANDIAKQDGASGVGGRAAHIGKTLWGAHSQAKADMPGRSSLQRMHSQLKAQRQGQKDAQSYKKV